MSNADEIIKLKELLDQNIITKDEFEKKKTELLGIKTNEPTNSITDSTTNSAVNYNAYSNKKKKNNSLLICVLVIAGLFFFGMFIAVLMSIGNNNNKNIVLDINQFYTSDKTDTITIEQLINMKGSKYSSEEWIYTSASDKKYSVVSYSYPDEETTYDFYNGRLYCITISKTISYTNRNTILEMFGLKTNSNTVKTLDNQFDLRYSNCGVEDFWVRGFENNTFCYVQIELKKLP